MPQLALAPPLKWAGGKRWLIPHLQSITSNLFYDRLVEPFAGGLAVALGLEPRRALLRDVNPHLINFYTKIQQGLDLGPFSARFVNDRGAYLDNRRRFNELVRDSPESDEAAALFYYLNRTGFNGLCRFNRAGEFNVPFGRYESVNYVANFADFKVALEHFEFQVGDFESTLVEPGDLLYADPPYDVQFTAYASGGFSWLEQVRVADWLASLDSHVIASNQATDRIVKLYKDRGFDVQILSAPRRISSSGDRTDTDEILAVRKRAGSGN